MLCLGAFISILNTMKNLAKLRTEITQLDTQLLALLAKRLQLVRKIGEYKKMHNLPIRDEKREEEILQDLFEKGKSLQISQELIKVIWKSIFQEAYKLEK